MPRPETLTFVHPPPPLSSTVFLTLAIPLPCPPTFWERLVSVPAPLSPGPPPTQFLTPPTPPCGVGAASIVQMAVPSSLATVLISFDSFGRLCHALQEPVNAHAGLSLTIPHRETVFRSVRLPLASTHTSRWASSPTTSAKISDIDICHLPIPVVNKLFISTRLSLPHRRRSRASPNCQHSLEAGPSQQQLMVLTTSY